MNTNPTSRAPLYGAGRIPWGAVPEIRQRRAVRRPWLESAWGLAAVVVAWTTGPGHTDRTRRSTAAVAAPGSPAGSPDHMVTTVLVRTQSAVAAVVAVVVRRTGCLCEPGAADRRNS